MLEVLEERKFPVTEMIPVGSSRSAGMDITYGGRNYKVVEVGEAVDLKPDLALFSAGSGVSLEWAPKFEQAGSYVIDNSSAWRMHEGIPLVVPEVNAHALKTERRIIANPNCSTIQMVVALAPLHAKWRIRRLVISTYQSITGTGKAAVTQYENERDGLEGPMVYPHPIFENCLPHCDIFLENGYTKEEMKLVHETRKILGSPAMAITATAVRVPVMGGHSESVNVEFEERVTTSELMEALASAPGLHVVDNPEENKYPMPLYAHNSDGVFVGRIRRDESIDNAFNMWIVSDNLRKGAATNAVQVAESLRKMGLINPDIVA
jgi:aspartate-semialdehyde dehydrogenase